MFKTYAMLSCAAALLLGGCGGAPMEESSPENLHSTEQSLIWACDGSREFERIWTRNGVEVGRELCFCNGRILVHGTLMGAYSQSLMSYCN